MPPTPRSFSVKPRNRLCARNRRRATFPGKGGRRSQGRETRPSGSPAGKDFWRRCSRASLGKCKRTKRTQAVKEAIAIALREFESKRVVPPTLDRVCRHMSRSRSIRHHVGAARVPGKAICPIQRVRNKDERKDQLGSDSPRGTRQSEYVNLGRPELDRTVCFLQDGGAYDGTFVRTLGMIRGASEWKAFAEHPDCALIHLVRLLALIGTLGPRNSGCIDWHSSQSIEQFRRSHTPRITLTHVAEAMHDVRVKDEALVAHLLESYFPVFRWETDAVWPYLADKIDLLERAFEPATGDWSFRWRRKRAFDNALRLLAAFPQVPPSLIAKLWDMAIGTSKADRLRAQKIVVKLPDLSDRLPQALTARASETRAVTAEWIGRLGDRQYVAALHKAAKAEKIDAALDEMLTALERLGEDVEPYLDRKKLLTDAQKGLKKGTPPALEWFPWAQPPRVRWQDSGKEVPKEVVTWLIVQNFKFKSPEAGPLLRRYCAMMQPADRAELGNFVLGAWVEQDLSQRRSDAECRAEAQKQAPGFWQTCQRNLQMFVKQGQTVPAHVPKTLQEAEDKLFRIFQSQLCSAAAEKGILAVAGACCDASAVGPVQRYLKDWYGIRAAQCKALIAMLSTIDHPAATQFLLSIANRFRTKGIREEAEKYVNALAERKGWTLDELADRTLPTAGFTDDGSLELSFGPRQFQLCVTPSLEAVLTDADGKTLKALPAPRKDDDEEQAKAAKKAFSSAKSELKKFTGMQTTRLYEAMCTQRTWTIADWQTYLTGHPLMKFLCQRLVWAAQTPSPPAPLPEGEGTQSPSPPAPLPSGRVRPAGEGSRLPTPLARAGEGSYVTFRPLDDGTFTDYEDNEVRLPADAELRVAHSCHVPAETATAWATHLADYSVTPLFTQFGRATYALPEEKRKESAIDDFCGHMVEAFKLRSLATKFGYTRGQAQDGGWFFDYNKSFPGLGLKVVLNFSGNGLPEENRPVALKDISFQQAAAEEEPLMQMSGGMALDEVPTVLLSECYNDLRTIAASGTGFDPAWEKKIGY